MTWSVVCEFAGTVREARDFARQHGVNYAQCLGTAPNGLPYVSLSGRCRGDLHGAVARMKALGWPREAVVVRVHDNHKAPGAG